MKLRLRFRAVVVEHWFDHRYGFAGHVIAGIGNECQQNYGHLIAANIRTNLGLIAQLNLFNGLPQLLACMEAWAMSRQLLQDPYTNGYIIIAVTHFARSRHWRSHRLGQSTFSLSSSWTRPGRAGSCSYLSKLSWKREKGRELKRKRETEMKRK